MSFSSRVRWRAVCCFTLSFNAGQGVKAYPLLYRQNTSGRVLGVIFFCTRRVYVGTVEGMNTRNTSCQGAAKLFILFSSARVLGVGLCLAQLCQYTFAAQTGVYSGKKLKVSDSEHE